MASAGELYPRLISRCRLKRRMLRDGRDGARDGGRKSMRLKYQGARVFSHFRCHVGIGASCRGGRVAARHLLSRLSLNDAPCLPHRLLRAIRVRK